MIKPIRVLYLTNNPNVGSTVRVLLDWLLLGPERGVEGYVAAPREGDLTSWMTQHKVPWRINRMHWPSRRWPFPSLFDALRLASWARRHRVQLVHCMEHDVYPFAVLLRRLYRVPLVCHVQFLVSRQFCTWAFSGARRPDALIWTANSQRIDCAAAMENVLAEDRQSVIPMGVDVTRYGQMTEQRQQMRDRWNIRPEEIVIGTASALRPRKRIEDFVEVVRRIALRDPRVVGLLAGDAPQGDEAYRERICRMIAESGLGRRLQWVGHMEPVEPFQHAVDIFVSASEYETFGMSVCEAMACRKPVVAYCGGSIAEVVGDAGRVVATGDLEGLYEGVKELVENSDLRRQMGEQGWERVRTVFSPSASMETLQAVYRRALLAIGICSSAVPAMENTRE